MDGERLRDFLEKSPDNIAVLTDYAAMEAFKSDTLANIQSSWTILSNFPKQVIALKATREAARVDPRAAGIANRLIEKTQTQSISEFSRVLASAAAGDWVTQTQLIQRGKWAKDHLERMLAKSDHMSQSINEFCSVFSNEELKRLRRKKTWTPAIADKFRELVFDETERAFVDHPDKLRWPGPKHIVNHFLFRHTLTYLVYVMELVKCGATERKAAKVRNDAVDVIYGTFATYYNGFMSDDTMALKTHQITRDMLINMGARVPEDYLEEYALAIAD